MPGDTSYQSFCPNPLPPVPGLEFDEDMLQILVKASRSLKQLDVSAQLIPNAELFISMYVRKEALMSSQMEGTQCTLDDILDPELDTNANLDTADVVNYVKAAQYALTRLHELPICNRLFREAHAILLEGVRGQEISTLTELDWPCRLRLEGCAIYSAKSGRYGDCYVGSGKVYQRKSGL